MAIQKIPFNKDLIYKNAKENVAKIRISRSDKTTDSIDGILLSKVVLSMTSNWEPILTSLGSIFPLAQNAAAFTGRNLATTGLYTRKFYKGGGGYLVLRPEFRIVDWDGTNQTNVLRQIKLLTQWTSPSGDVTKEDEGQLDKTKGNVSRFFTKGKSAIKDLKTNLITGAPPHVTVELSSYFNSKNMGAFAKDFVITNLTV